jgi:hypothetical protein
LIGGGFLPISDSSLKLFVLIQKVAKKSRLIKISLNFNRPINVNTNIYFPNVDVSVDRGNPPFKFNEEIVIV